jgi:crotonobetainyl-CoA:carnitine CoA-transferase CaiB-like acyl-CoA transferase
MSTEAPLTGSVVAELGSRIGAGVCGSVLAQLGATVVVPEAERADEGKQAHRAQFMAGKRSMTYDRGSCSDTLLLERLVDRSDVLILSSDIDRKDPSYWSRYSDHSRVVCDVTAFGRRDSELSGEPYTEAQVQAVSGIIDTTGFAESPPTPIALPIVEFMTGIYAAAACQAALRVRRLGGGGQLIDMALYDCAFGALATFLPKLVSGESGDIARMGNRHSMAAPWNVYKAEDGWVLVCAASDDQWQRITHLIGQPALAKDPRYLRVGDRVQRGAEVDAALQGWVGGRSIARCLEAFVSIGIPSGPVAKVDRYPREANLDHRRMIRTLIDPVSGCDVFVPASPLRMTLTPGLSPGHIPAPDANRSEIMDLCAAPAVAAASIRRSEERPPMPLEGVRVIEIGHYTTAPLSARHLASLGADVIKVEPPAGEAVRAWSPVKNGTGYFFMCTNSNKRSLTLDLETEDGLAILRDLIACSDVLLENLKPGALAKRGYSAADIQRINPRIVYCAVSGFGADSAYSGRPAFDSVIQAMSGVMDLTRTGDMPVKTGPSSADIIGAEMGVVAVLAALEARERCGAGQYIDLSMQDIAAWVTMLAWNRPCAPYATQVLRAQDGFIVIEQDDADVPHALPAHLTQDVSLCMKRTELCAALSKLGWRTAPILTVRETLESGQTRTRKLIASACDGAGEVWPLLASPLRLERTPPAPGRPMSPLGGDGPAILALLGRAAELRSKRINQPTV